jgi:hypothetical protein
MDCNLPQSQLELEIARPFSGFMSALPVSVRLVGAPSLLVGHNKPRGLDSPWFASPEGAKIVADLPAAYDSKWPNPILAILSASNEEDAGFGNSSRRCQVGMH